MFYFSFFIIGIGYYIGKKDPKFNTKFITNFAGQLVPHDDFLYNHDYILHYKFTEYFIYAVIILSAFVVGFIFLLLLKKDPITELPPMFLPNTGNMGVPICLFAYGTAGLGVASAIASVIILFHFTIGYC